jgi:UDP-2-acetamido-3-amino-2,3-dideoxy-glucuronate N-acetyltransferase
VRSTISIRIFAIHSSRMRPDQDKMMSNDFFSHESTYIDDGAQVGAGTRIWHFSHIMPGAIVGKKCNIGQNVVVSPGCRIGDNVKIQNNVSVYTGVILEDDVFCGPSMVFTNVINPRSHIERKDEYKTTLVKKGATIGANSTIICGVTLGQYCFIGAGSVVTRDVPDFGLVLGCPGRLVDYVCFCGDRLHFDLNSDSESRTCGSCARRYNKKAREVLELKL